VKEGNSNEKFFITSYEKPYPLSLVRRGTRGEVTFKSEGKKALIKKV
jgi:hypothetical protein